MEQLLKVARKPGQSIPGIVGDLLRSNLDPWRRYAEHPAVNYACRELCRGGKTQNE